MFIMSGGCVIARFLCEVPSVKNSRLKIKNKQSMVILGVFIAGIAICLLLESQMTDQFIRRSEAITKGIAKNIEDIDNMMTQVLKNSIIGWSEMIDSGKSDTMEQAIKIRDKFDVDNMDIWDSNGGMELDTDGTHIPGGRYYEKYNKSVFSLFQADCCPLLRDMALKDPVITQFYRGDRSGVPKKFAILYNSTSKKYLTMEYNRANVANILINNVNIYDDLIYLRLSAPVEEIASHGKHSNSYEIQTKLDQNIAYTDPSVVSDSRLITEIVTIFGNKYKAICTLGALGRSNTSGEYFYERQHSLRKN
ncbi:hypothetical protein MIDIC_110119 [Alphaproteobacteria bacterium]